LAVKREAKGLHVDALDLMICAIASDVKASISTRNIGDFDGCGVVLINPCPSSIPAEIKISRYSSNRAAEDSFEAVDSLSW
jgi:hypothetical protein